MSRDELREAFKKWTLEQMKDLYPQEWAQGVDLNADSRSAFKFCCEDLWTLFLAPALEALEYYKHFAQLPEDVQLKERIGGGRADQALTAIKEKLGVSRG